MKKLAVILRTCNSEIDAIGEYRPHWFDKFLCFESLYSEFGEKPDIDFYVIHDGDQSKFSEFIQRRDVLFSSIGARNNEKSLLHCYDLFDDIQDNYLGVYFVEDDYFLRRGARNVTIEGIERFGLFTTFHSMDRYNFIGAMDVSYGCEYVFLMPQNNILARSVESTTCTVAMTTEYFNQLKSKLRYFALNDRAFYRDIYQQSRGLRLFSSIPAFSAHCVIKPTNVMCPLIDWEKETHVES